jgi:hypothetical protein
MCINMTKSRIKCHNVVDLHGEERYAINDPHEKGGILFYAELVRGEKHAFIYPVEG